MSVRKDDIENCPPRPDAMIHSMRAFGYDLGAAVADLIDNSITAKARNVLVNFHWAGRDSWVTIMDDGEGMTEKQLSAAMVLGSQSPLANRDLKDLGRFGLGLKTASFSQCKRLTVCSRRKGKQAVRRWDLDFISAMYSSYEEQWPLLKTPAKGAEKRLHLPDKWTSGTTVLWEIMDKVVGDVPSSDVGAQRHFLKQIDATRKYLAMVFHRYLEGTRPALKMFINGTEKHNRIEPWDPFLESLKATIRTPEEKIKLKGKAITFQGFVLPHKDKLGDELHRETSGPAGWNAQQGFYVYRNKRLLVAGDWLGLGENRPWTNEEHYKLARIRIDIPNSMDTEWQIDVKKSTATPPAGVRDRLKDLASRVRKDAREVFSHRGKYGPRKKKPDIVRPWESYNRNGQPAYRIVRKHPLVIQALKDAGGKKDALEALLQVVEETVPVQRIWLDTAEKPDSHLLPFQGRTLKEITKNMNFAYEALRNNGLSHVDTIRDLGKAEEYSEYGELIRRMEQEDL